MIDVGVFIPDNNDEHIRVLSAFFDGIKKDQRVNVKFHSVDKYVPVDIAVVFGIGKKNVPASYARGHIILSHIQRGKDVIVLEKGYINRHRYYAAGWNGLNGRADFCNQKMPDSRFRDLGINVKEWKKGGKNIVVCGQVPTDASVQNIDIFRWSHETIQEILRMGYTDVIFRPHPLAINRTPNMIGAKTSTRPLEEDLNDAHAVITYNSNTAVEAAIAGVPVFAFDEGSMAWPIANKDLIKLHNPDKPDRSQWLNDIAFSQWTLDEMQTGLAWFHLMRCKQHLYE